MTLTSTPRIRWLPLLPDFGSVFLADIRLEKKPNGFWIKALWPIWWEVYAVQWNTQCKSQSSHIQGTALFSMCFCSLSSIHPRFHSLFLLLYIVSLYSIIALIIFEYGTKKTPNLSNCFWFVVCRILWPEWLRIESHKEESHFLTCTMVHCFNCYYKMR